MGAWPSNLAFLIVHYPDTLRQGQGLGFGQSMLFNYGPKFVKPRIKLIEEKLPGVYMSIT